MTEELTYILSLLLSEQERDVIKAIIAERDELRSENNQLRGEVAGLRQCYERDYIPKVSRLEAEVATMTADRDSEQRWANMYSGQSARLDAMVTNLRTALEFYADVSTYQNSSPNNDDSYRVDYKANIDMDGGGIARKALEVLA